MLSHSIFLRRFLVLGLSLLPGLVGGAESEVALTEVSPRSNLCGNRAISYHVPAYLLGSKPETGRMFAFISDEGNYIPGGESTAPTPLTYFTSGMAL